MEIDPEAVRSAIVDGLPARARWMLGEMPLDFDFSVGRGGPRPLTDEDVCGGIEEEWADLLLFGECDYADGGGARPWLAIRRSGGGVCALDVEWKDPISTYNTSIERFIRVFALLDPYLGHGRPLPPETEDRVRAIDPEGYELSEWKDLIDHVGTYERETGE